MTLSIWTLLGLCLICLFLYIFGFIKKITLLRKISSGFILPISGSVSVLLLTNSLPDSFHIIVVTIPVFFLCSVSEILFLFNKNRVLVFLSKLSFIAGQIIWLELLKSTFYINRVSLWMFIPFVILYLIITVFTFIFAGKSNIQEYIADFLALICIFSVNYCSVINLCFLHNLYSVLCVAGTLCGAGMTVFYIITKEKFNFKYRNNILFLLLVISQSLISYSNILMIR